MGTKSKSSSFVMGGGMVHRDARADAELARAEAMATLSAEATAAVEMAGRGLKDVFGDCASNAPTTRTIYNLATVQGYISEALVALCERQRHENPTDGTLLVAKG